MRFISLSPLLLFAVLLQVSISSAQAAAYKLSDSVHVQGKVLKLDLPAEGRSFGVIWTAPGKKKWSKVLVSRKGPHLYEMRDHPDWRGTVKGIYITGFENPPWDLVVPSFEDEKNIFLTPQLLRPATINFLKGHSLIGWKWDTILLLLAFGIAVVIMAYKRNITLSLLLAFVASWALMDFRTMYDHLRIAQTIEDNNSIKQFIKIKDSSRRVEPQIGEKSWARGRMRWPAQVIIPYELADKKYVEDSDNPDADFTISYVRGQLVLKEKNGQK